MVSLSNQRLLLGTSQAASLADALSNPNTTDVVQLMMNDYHLVRIKYWLFPTSDVFQQNQAVARLICETMPNAQVGEVTAWVDALAPEELEEFNRRDINIALSRS
jgi:hypothetical protein